MYDEPPPALAPAGPRRRRGVFWTGVVLTVLVVAGGTALAVRSIVRSAGPDGAVRAYFAALTRADAPAALALGTVPAGPRTLLTADVLREQRRIAPISDVSIDSTQQSGGRADVHVSYTVGFPGAPRQVSDEVAVHHTAAGWRLVQVAVATQLSVIQAAQRATILGGTVPVGTELVFPGPVPIRFDTPYLQLRPAMSVVTFDSGPTVQILPTISAAGRQATLAAIEAGLRSCLGAGAGNLRCPEPDTRLVPGTLHGAVAGSLAGQLSIGIGFGAAGVIDVSGVVNVRGTYRELTFSNQSIEHTGMVQVMLHADGYAVAPLAMSWTSD